MPSPINIRDDEEWIEAGFEYAFEQNPSFADLGITRYYRNVDLTDEVDATHVEIKCVACYPYTSHIDDGHQVLTVDITVRSSQGTDFPSAGSVFSTNRLICLKLAGAVRSSLYDSNLTSYLQTGGDNRTGSVSQLLLITNDLLTRDPTVDGSASDADVVAMDISDQNAHMIRFTVSVGVKYFGDV